MSWEATAHVLKLAERTTRQDLSPTCVLVLLALAARHHRDICCAFGQYKRMAADTHLDDDTIVRAVNYLEATEYVRVYFGPLPIRTRNGKPIMGNLYCFVGLDPDEGPDLDGVQPRRRLGGRPMESSSATPNWSSSDAPVANGTGRALKAVRSDRSKPTGLTAVGSSVEPSGLGAPPAPPRLTGAELTGNREPEREPIGKPDEVNSDEEIVGKNARRNGRAAVANGSEKPAAVAAQLPLIDAVPAPPRQPVECVCPMANHTFVGSYQEHLATDPRHQARRPEPRARRETA